MKRILALLAVVVGVSLAGCGGSDGSDGEPAASAPDAPAQGSDAAQGAADSQAPAVDATRSDLEGRTFTATEAKGAELTDKASLEISFENRRLSVDAGCNRIGGNYSLEAGEIQAFLSSTLMGCPPEETELEVFVSELFRQGAAATLSGDTLVIEGKNATTLTLVD